MTQEELISILPRPKAARALVHVRYDFDWEPLAGLMEITRFPHRIYEGRCL